MKCLGVKKIHELTIKFPEAHLFATNYTEVYSKEVSVKPASNLKNFDKDGIILDFFESNYLKLNLSKKSMIF